MTRSSFVAVEVWLGPMEGLRHVAPAVEGAATTIRIGRVSVDKKTNTRNEFVLSYGYGVSSAHAEVRFERGHLLLKDNGSTNGTSVRSGHVTGEVEIAPGEVFLVSSTPVRVRLLEATLPEMPFPRVLRGEAYPVPAVQSIVRGAREAANQRGELFADSRHLCDALVRSRSATIQRILREANWSREQALAELWEGHLFAGDFAWLNDLFLQPLGLKTGSDEVILSPKVGFFLEESQRRSVESSAMDLETTLRTALLSLLRQDEESAVGAWLARRLPDFSPRAAAPAAAPSAPPARPARPAAPEPQPAPRPEAPAPRAEDLRPAPARSEEYRPPAGLSRDDIALDRKAREVAEGLVREAAAYRFSTPSDRRDALRTFVNRELHGVAPDRRTRLLEQLRLQFPVSVPPDVSSAEEARLRKRVADLERRLAEAAQAPAAAPREKEPAAGPLPWKALVAQDDAAAAKLDPRLAVLREVLRFSQDVETFTLGLVEAMTMPGAETASFRLPNFRDRLSGFLTAAAEGKEVNPEEMREYLAELRRWQIAISAGHHEAPKLWFSRLWKKISPSVIESGKGGAGWKLRGETAEWWNQYRELVKDLNPDLVQDQVLQAAAHFSQSEFQKLNKRK